MRNRSTKKDKIFSVRSDPESYQKYSLMAELLGMGVSEWMRSLADAQLVRVEETLRNEISGVDRRPAKNEGSGSIATPLDQETE